MISPGLTVRDDLTIGQIRRLIALTQQDQPRNWYWLTDWVRGELTGYGEINFSTTDVPLVNQSVDADDIEGIISAYENPDNWEGYTEEDMAAA